MFRHYNNTRSMAKFQTKKCSESNNATYKKRKFGTLGDLAFFELFPAVPYT